MPASRKSPSTYGHSYVAKHTTKRSGGPFLVEHKICQCMKMATLSGEKTITPKYVNQLLI